MRDGSAGFGLDPERGILARLCNTPGCHNLKQQRQGVRYCESCRAARARAARLGPIIPAWGCEEDALLGTKPDRLIAELIGRSGAAVRGRRLKLGIAKFKFPPRRVNVRRGSKSQYLATGLPKGHRFRAMARYNGDVLVHRLVMAEHLDRSLAKDEFVHHRNGDPGDNRIENLELWTRSHPDGQRVEDVFEWCVEFIERYAREQG